VFSITLFAHAVITCLRSTFQHMYICSDMQVRIFI